MRGDNHQPPHVLVEQHAHVLGVDEGQRDRKRRRQGHQHVARHAPVRGVHPHLAENLEPLPDDVREVVEDLGEVAAGLALDQDGGDEEPHVDERHALAQVAERVLERDAEVLLLERLLELRADGIRRLVGDHAHGGRERVAGPDGARQQIESLGELLLEPGHATGALAHQHQDRHRGAGEGSRAASPTACRDATAAMVPVTSPSPSDISTIGADADVRAGLADDVCQAAAPPHLSREPVENRERADDLPLQDRGGYRLVLVLMGAAA